MMLHPTDIGPLGPSGPVGPRRETVSTGPSGGSEGASFDAVLEKAIRLSAHARERLAGQGIEFDPNDLDRLAGAVDQAAARGSKDSLLVYRNVGLVVNIKNRTVLTALDQARMKSGVVTGIDSTVFVQETETEEPREDS